MNASEAKIGLHVWAHVKDMAINELNTSLLYPYEEDVECIIQELGRNGQECMLRFAHPGDVPQGVRIGWRKYEDITPVDTDITSLEQRMKGMYKRNFG